MKNLVIAAVGDDSLHGHWVAGERDFDLSLLYYGDNDDLATAYQQTAQYFLRAKGMKYHLIDRFLQEQSGVVSQYSYIWLPDDDVMMSTAAISQMFALAEKYSLGLCQPANAGYLSHPITAPAPGALLRFTNFVEVLAPLMSLPTLITLQKTFTLNHSGWGFDYLWPYLLGYPRRSIAVLDGVTMVHTKPIGTDYSRFPIHPKKEMKAILKPYGRGIQKEQVMYGMIGAE